ncbi:MAG: acyl-CoA carboxylase subunit epsilon [Jatrophihabitantaceae bacterium]
MSTDAPALRIVRGEPTPEELAVVTALVTAASGGDDDPEPPRRGRWADPAGQHVPMRRPGPGAWASSLR